jgi:hypothetical protein
LPSSGVCNLVDSIRNTPALTRSGTGQEAVAIDLAALPLSAAIDKQQILLTLKSPG